MQGLPLDTALPYFAYGALKNGEIAWNQISDFVRDAQPAVVPGYKIGIVDGTAYGIPHLLGTVRGDLIHFEDSEAAYERISIFEGMFDPKPRYEWTEVTVGETSANMLKARQIPQRYEQTDFWTVAADPVFAEGLRWIHKQLSQLVGPLKDGILGYRDKELYWSDFFILQSVYLFQWGFHERLEAYRLGATKDDKPGTPGYVPIRRTMGDRRREMAQDPDFVQALSMVDYDKNLAVRGYRHPHHAGSTTEFNPLKAWYELRNNISHHGKGSEHELEKVLRSTVDHFNTLLEFVRIVSPRLAENYKDLTQIKMVM